MKKRLIFENYFIVETLGSYILQSPDDNEKLTKLLSQMVGFGYIQFIPGAVSISIDDVINFWFYAHEKIISV